jgi:hypothetical protein
MHSSLNGGTVLINEYKRHMEDYNREFQYMMLLEKKKKEKEAELDNLLK